jgi:hypothetical protein
MVVEKEPPRPVEEMPPDQKPAGANVQWIPGYWSWDQARSDFLWISGVWREPPPGRQWVPGYWHQVQGGFQWVPGAWVPLTAAASEGPAQSAVQTPASYLPPPPASLETGPNSPAPSPGVFWSPGSWYWQENRYVWRPGFWAAAQPSWVWIPAHFVWTPGGYLFVDGYWDLPLASRGILFAPVYYPQPVYLQPSYVFTPSITIATPGLVANLFVQPGYGHYCFGDYYDRTFLSVGIFPWFSFTYASGPARPVFYDPIFTFYASVNVSRDPGWVTRVREDYIVRRDNVAMRPPRTYVEQTRIFERNVNITNNVTVIQGGRGRDLVMATPIHEFASHSEAAGAIRLEHVSALSRRQWQERGAELGQFRTQRTRLEQQVAMRPAQGGGEGRRGAQAARPLSLPASPVSAPIHHHLASGEPIGPTSRSDHRAALQGSTEHPGLHYEQRGGERPSPFAEQRAGAPSIRHQEAITPPMPDHSLGLGQVAPHDSGRSPLLGSGSRMTGRETVPRSDLLRLHAPPQYTHRQPPPPPRPVPRHEPREGHRSP